MRGIKMCEPPRYEMQWTSTGLCEINFKVEWSNDCMLHMITIKNILDKIHYHSKCVDDIMRKCSGLRRYIQDAQNFINNAGEVENYYTLDDIKKAQAEYEFKCKIPCIVHQVDIDKLNKEMMELLMEYGWNINPTLSISATLPTYEIYG